MMLVGQQTAWLAGAGKVQEWRFDVKGLYEKCRLSECVHGGGFATTAYLMRSSRNS